MARKSRTPTPPRTVQAPQRRRDSKRRGALGDRRNLLLIGLGGVGVLAAIVAAVVVFTHNNEKGAAAPNVPAASQLVGLQTGPAPWNQGLDTLPDRVDAVGVHELTTEGEVLHIHQHLDIFVNGKPMPLPADIGIYDGQFTTELHTHDSSGIVHVESPTATNFDLGQFFGVWGVRLSSDCIGGYCRQVTPWSVYVNGRSYTGDPGALVLKPHQEIAFVIGTPPKQIPSSYTFPPHT